ncbi:MAG: anaerobic carbon-monoxide dehydrogenase catalytic subunit [Desulfobacterales bacterium]|nr:anaerobic carbon-monoxide dehydrogenase catalytic subunit [Desulfobacterales bacterium]
MSEIGDKTVDAATRTMLEKAAGEGIETVFDRAEKMKPCPIGSEGSCCRNCAMGPCRIPAPKKKPKDPEKAKKRMGLCGATAETIAARNFARMIASGCAAHSDHGRGVAEVFVAAAKGEIPGYSIQDEQKLYQVAMDFGVEIGERDIKDIAIDVGEKALAEFGRQEGELAFIKRAPLKRQEIWRKLNIVPRGIDREVVEIMHRTHMGVDQDYRNLMLQGSRAALADGWGGSMVATELQDILFGTPVPLVSKINLGVLKEEDVNLIVHGHEPLLSEMIAAVSQDPEMIQMAQSVGAKGITVAGMCCTANEILMRHGFPIAGNFLQQELAITTGAVDAMIVDVQCIMENLVNVAKCYHTKLITTSPKAKIDGATHVEFDEHDAINTAKRIVRTAIENFPNRTSKVLIPDERTDIVAGFSHETINYLLGGIFRASYRPLNDNIINGRIRGIGGVVGCNNARTTHDSSHLTVVKELLKNDVIVLTTGCNAMACGKAGLLTPEAASKYCGEGLASVCETVGIPPVLHMGSCVDNSRILMAATAVVKDGGLGDDLSDVPAAGCAPEWMSEKAISIGQYFVASGVFTVFGVTFPIMGSEGMKDLLFNEFEETLGGKWAFEKDPEKMAKLMIEHIDKKRKALGIDKARERVLYDMEMRQKLDAA